MSKTRTIDGIAPGNKHASDQVNVRILQRMAASNRRLRPRKPVLAKWRGVPILTRVCTKAIVREAK